MWIELHLSYRLPPAVWNAATIENFLLELVWEENVPSRNWRTGELA
jgi:hypothetical protein